MGECDIVTVPDTANVQHTPVPDLIQNTVEYINEVPENHLRGRNDYKSEYNDIACRLTAAYFTEQDVAYALGVSTSTVQSWKRKFPAFKAACEDGRRETKKRLVAQAMKQAVGYKYVEKNVKTVFDADGSVIKSETSEFHKEQPGSGNMLLFLLLNFDRQLKDAEWQSVNKVEVSDNSALKIVVDAKEARAQIQRLAGELGSGQ